MSGYDPPQIGNRENPHAWEHTKIKAAADSLAPSNTGTQQQTWASLGESLQSAAETFNTAIKSAIEANWEGKAAESASGGVKSFAESTTNLATAFGGNIAPIIAATGAATAFKSTVPEVVPVTSGSNERIAEKRNAEEQEARELMQRLYVNVYSATDMEVPVLPPPHNPIAATPVVGPPSIDGSGPGLIPGTDGGKAGGGNTGGGDTGSGNGSGGSTGGSGATQAASADPNQAAAQSFTSQQATGQNPVGNAATTPAAAGSQSSAPVLPAASGGASSGQPSSWLQQPVGYGGGGAGSRSVGGGGSSAGGGGGGAAGGSLSGTPALGGIQVGGATAAGGATGAGMSGRPGVAGAPGMGMAPAAARGKGDDDSEHKSPGYLVHEDNATELIGKMRPTTPPVLGG